MIKPLVSSVIRAYDIRGIVGRSLFPEDAYAVGRALAHLLEIPIPQVGVACDGRLTSPVFKERLIAGLCEGGACVLDMGLGPSPLMYFGVKTLGIDAGVIVTASHNPAEYNGFKVCLRERPFFGEDLQRLNQILAEGELRCGRGYITDCAQQLEEEYLQRLQEEIVHLSSLRVAWDAGNGAAGKIMSKLLSGMPGQHYPINLDIDGRFPAHHPDPVDPKNLSQLQELVIQHRCDVGIAFDGDGDRIGVIDDTGEILWADQLMHLYVEDVLRHHPGAGVILDVKSSRGLYRKIEHLGGKPIICRTGHSFIKQKMRETGALLAGEMSGHIFFADRYYGFDDALYAALRLLRILTELQRPLSVYRATTIPQTHMTPELHFLSKAEEKFQTIKRIQRLLEQQGIVYTEIDGLKVEKEAGWWLLRASNTQDILVGRCEGETPEALTQMQRELEFYLNQCIAEI